MKNIKFVKKIHRHMKHHHKKYWMSAGIGFLVFKLISILVGSLGLLGDNFSRAEWIGGDWNNEVFIDETFWDGARDNSDVVGAFFGYTIGDQTAYTQNWNTNDCDPNNINVIELNPGEDTLPDLLDSNTIYVLDDGDYKISFTNGILANNSGCIGIVGKGNVKITSNFQIYDGIINFENQGNIIIDNIEIDGSSNGGGSTHDNNMYGLKFFYTPNVSINKVEISNTFYGIGLNNSANSLVNASILYNNNDGIYLEYSPDSITNNNELFANTHGIYLGYSDRSIVHNSRLYNNNAGLDIFSSNIDTNNCQIFNNLYGVWDLGTGYNTINNSQIYNNDYGTYFSSSSNNIINHSQIYNNDYGTYFSSSSNDNKINNCWYYNNNYGLFGTNSSNNKYYGSLNAFYNDSDVYGEGVAQGRGSEVTQLGRSDGTMDGGFDMSRNYITNPMNNEYGYMLGRDLDFNSMRGYISTYTGYSQKYSYGSGIINQSDSVIYDGFESIYGGDIFDTNKYIGSDINKKTGNLVGFNGNIISNNIIVTGGSTSPITKYSLFGDIENYIYGQDINTSTGVTLTSGIGEKKIITQIYNDSDYFATHFEKLANLVVDSTPNVFSFNEITGAELLTTYNSNTITLEGMSPGASTGVTLNTCTSVYKNGSLVTGLFTGGNGDQFYVSKTSPSNYNTLVSCTLSIGGVGSAFIITTKEADYIPVQFTFVDIISGDINTIYTSNIITITGMSPGLFTGISINNGNLFKNGINIGTDGTGGNGDQFYIQLTSSQNYYTNVSSTMTIGGIWDNFRIYTISGVVDIINPVVSDSYIYNGITGSNGVNKYYVNYVDVRADVSDDSGISGTTCEYTTGGGTWRQASYTGSATTGYCYKNQIAESVLNINFRVKDISNNLGTGTSNTYYYDSNPPSFTFSNKTGYECERGTMVILDSNDAGIGLNLLPYNFNFAGRINNPEINITPQQAGTIIIVTGAVRDVLGNQLWQQATYTFLDVGISVNDFTGDNNIGNSSKTVNRLISGNVQEGECGDGDIEFSGMIYRGNKGICEVNGYNVSYMPLQNKTGSDYCSFQIKDNEGSTANISIYWGGIDTMSDYTPDQFSFSSIIDADINYNYTSNTIRIQGMSPGLFTGISIDNGDLFKNGLNIGTSGTGGNDDEFYIQMRSSSEYYTSVYSTMEMGGTSGVFEIRTQQDPYTSLPSITWDNNNFINQNFWSQGPLSGDIIIALFGTGTNDKTAYTQNRSGNNCDPNNITVEYKDPGTDTIPLVLSGNYVYVLNSGNYIISDTIELSGNCIAILGSGKVNISSSDYLSNSIFYSDGNRGIIFDNLYIDGSSYGQGSKHAPNYHGINIWNNINSTVNRVSVYNTDYSIYYNNSHYNYFNHVRSYNNNYNGIMIVEYSTNNIINNSQFFNNGFHGILFNDTNQNSVNNSQSYNNGQYGIAFVDSNKNIINNSQFYNNLLLAGIQYYNSYGNIINNSQSYNNMGGLYFFADLNGNMDLSYYGDFKIMNNLEDYIVGHSNVVMNKGFASDITGSMLGWTDGDIINQEEVGMDYMVNPSKEGGSHLIGWDQGLAYSIGRFENFDDKADVYSYGEKILNQSKPVYYYDNTLLSGLDFEEDNYIGSDIKKYTGSLAIQVSEKASNTVDTIFTCPDTAEYYAIMGDVTTRTGACQSGPLNVSGLNILGGNGEKNLVIQYQYSGINIRSHSFMGFSAILPWNNDNFIDQIFWDGNPSSGDIKEALFGTGVSDITAYTKNWSGNNCNPNNIQVEYITQTGINTIPQFLSGNTIYVLNEGKYSLSGYNSGIVMSGCSAIIGSGDITIYSEQAISGSIYSYNKIGNIIDNLNIDGKNKINGSTHINNSYGIYFYGQKNKTINEAKVYNNYSKGIYIQQSNNTYINNCDIFDIYYLNDGEIGIHLQNSMNNIINNTNVYNIGGNLTPSNTFGIYLGSSNYNILNNSKIFGAREGIKLDGDSSYNLINNTLSFNNYQKGVNLDNGNFNIINNSHFLNNGADGIYIGSNSRDNTLHDVYSYNNASAGIFVAKSSTYNIYMGVLKLFGNGGAGNINIGEPDDLMPGYIEQFSGLGWVAGYIDPYSEMGCSWDINPSYVGGSYLQTGELCNTKAKIVGLTGPVVGYMYGSNITKQDRPIKRSGDNILFYNTDPVSYDSGKYIGDNSKLGGTFSINNNDDDVYKYDVKLYPNKSNHNTVDNIYVRFSNNGSEWSGWKWLGDGYSYNWKLNTAGSNQKKVYVEFSGDNSKFIAMDTIKYNLPYFDPEPFTFNRILGAQTGTFYTSDEIVLAGMSPDVDTGIYLSGSSGFSGYILKSGENIGTYGSGGNGDIFKIVLRSSNQTGTKVFAKLIIGNTSGVFEITTWPNYIPNQFTFNNITNAESNQLYTSNVITIQGMTTGYYTGMSVNTGYIIKNSINIGPSGTGGNGDQIYLALTSSNSELTRTSSTLNIGGTSSTFNIKTKRNSAFDWNNDNFIDQSFWNKSPNSGDIKYALFGEGNYDPTAYTRRRSGNNCDYVDIKVTYLSGGLDTIPQKLSGNTIYVLHSGNYRLSYRDGIEFNANCSAIIGSGNVTMYSTGKISESYGYSDYDWRNGGIINSMDKKYTILDNVRIDGMRNGVGGTHEKNYIGVKYYKSSSNTINNIYSYNNSNYGIFIKPDIDYKANYANPCIGKSSDYNTVNNSKLFGNRFGIGLCKANHTLIENTDIFNGNRGVEIWTDSHYNVINNTKFYGMSWVGVAILDTYNSINNSLFFDTNFTVFSMASNKTKIRNTQSYFNSMAFQPPWIDQIDTGDNVQIYDNGNNEKYVNIIDANGNYYLNWNNYSKNALFQATMPLSYIYGSGILLQSVPAIYSGNSIIYTGNYNPSKYIGSDTIKLTGDLLGMSGIDTIQSLLTGVSVGLTTHYSIFGDIAIPVIGQSINTATGVTRSGFNGLKKLVVVLYNPGNGFATYFEKTGNVNVTFQQTNMYSGINSRIGLQRYYAGGSIAIKASIDSAKTINTGSCEYTVNNSGTRHVANYSGNAYSGYCYKTNISGDSDLRIGFKIKYNDGETIYGPITYYILDNTAPTFTFSGKNTSECDPDTLIITGVVDTGAGLHSSPYAFPWSGSTPIFNTSYKTAIITGGGEFTLVGCVRDAVLNTSCMTGSFTITDSQLTQSVGTKTYNANGKYLNRQKQNLLEDFGINEGLCGQTNVSLIAETTTGTKGTCAISPIQILYTAFPYLTGEDSCILRVKDNEGNTLTGIIEITNIYGGLVFSVSTAYIYSGVWAQSLSGGYYYNSGIVDIRADIYSDSPIKTGSCQYTNNDNYRYSANYSGTSNTGYCYKTGVSKSQRYEQLIVKFRAQNNESESNTFTEGTSRTYNIDNTGPIFSNVAPNNIYECSTGYISVNWYDLGVGLDNNPYSFDGNSWGADNSTGFTAGNIGNYLNWSLRAKDKLSNISYKTGTYIVVNTGITANNFTGSTNVGNNAITVNRLNLSNAQEGACGNSSITFSGIVNNGSKGVCTQVGLTGITYTPNANKTGSDSCRIGIKDDEGSGSNVTIYREGINTMGGGGDYIPDPFTFINKTGAEVNTLYTSNIIVITGMTPGFATGISVNTGYIIKNSTIIGPSGTGGNGDQIILALTSSNNYSTTVSSILNVGGVSGQWSITTISGDTTAPVLSTGLIYSGSRDDRGANRYYKGTIDIRASVSDNIGISGNTCEYTINNGSNRYSANYSGTNTTGYCYKTSILGGSDLNIIFRVKDSSNNLGTGIVGNYVYDNTPPTFNFENNSGYECIAGTLTITNAIDTGVGLNSSPYSFDGSIWNNNTGIAINQAGGGSVGTIVRTGYVRDVLGNTAYKASTYTFLDSPVTANNFTGSTSVGDTSITVNRLTASNAQEGSCGNGYISFSGFVSTGTKGTCTPVGSTGITYTPNANQTGSDSCTIQIKDNEGSTANVTIYRDGINTMGGGGDYIPDPFTFINKTGAEVNTLYTSNVITITGMSLGLFTGMNVNTGYIIKNNINIGPSGTGGNGDQIILALTSSNNYSTTVSSILNVGGVTGSWLLTTKNNTSIPSVIDVTSDNSNGTYGSGSSIDIKVKFNEAVKITGLPKLTLNTSPVRTGVYLDMGMYDVDFNVGSGFNGIVNTIVIQNDGKILVGGDFTSYMGISSPYIIRLNSDGNKDNSFNVNNLNSPVNTIAVQTDGKIIVGGGGKLLRLNGNGQIDSEFGEIVFANNIYDIKIQNDGKIIVGGNFNGLLGNQFIARINSDGSKDNSFNIGSGFNDTIETIAIQNNEKIIVGGRFTSYNGETSNRIIRLNDDGTKDPDFNIGNGFNNIVLSTAIQNDGKIIVGGGFWTYSGTAAYRIARINVDGSKDNSFSPIIGSDVSHSVTSLIIQSDDKIIVGGYFGNGNIKRLNNSGIIDTTFNIGSGFNQAINSLIMDMEDRIIAGGLFTSFNNNNIGYLARLSEYTQNKVFRYSVQSGDISSDLDYFNNNALVLDGGTIKNTNYIDANLELSTPGTTGSLGYNKDIVVGNIDYIPDPFYFDMIWNATLNTLYTSNIITITGMTQGLFTGMNVNTGYIIKNNINIGQSGTGGNGDQIILALTSSNNYSTTVSSILNVGGVTGSWLLTTKNNTSIPSVIDVTSDNSNGTYGSGSSIDIKVKFNEAVKITGLPKLTLNTSPVRTGVYLDMGMYDVDFNVGSGFNGPITSLAIQTDGKIVVGGGFSSYNGTSVKSIARLNTDGTLDTGFNIGDGFDNSVDSLAIQTDEKIVVGGGFSSYNGTSVKKIARLNTDGTLDTGFNIGNAFDIYPTSLAIQVDGKIVVGGASSIFMTKRIVRLNTDGTLDTGFNVGDSFNGTVTSLAIQSDRKIVVGGWFSSYNGTSVKRIARLNTDGTLDTGFNIGSGFDTDVESLAIQIDGKIVVGGYFTNYNGTSVKRIARLNTDGTLDTGFNVGDSFNGTIKSLAIQTGGKIVVGGYFTNYNGTSVKRIARLNTDGTLDTGFNIGDGFDNYVESLAIQIDGNILVGGGFSSYNGTIAKYIARLGTYTYPEYTQNKIFRYTVQNGDYSNDLDYLHSGSLVLDGGAIKNRDNTEADLTLSDPWTTGSLGYNKNIVIIATTKFQQPYIYSGTTGANGNTLYYKGIVDIRADVSNNYGISGSTCEYTINNGFSRSGANYSGTSTTGYCYKTGIVGGIFLRINFRVKDSSNNRGIGPTITYRSDNTGPIFTFANNSGNECVDGNLSIAFASDEGIGLHASPYSFDGSVRGTATSTVVSSQNTIESEIRTGYVRDALANTAIQIASYTFNNVVPTANNFTGSTNVINSAKTADWLTLSNAQEGACGTTSLSFSGIVSQGSKGVCLQAGGTGIIYTPNANQMGADSCVIQIKDNENSVVNITIYRAGIDTTIADTTLPTVLQAYIYNGTTGNNGSTLYYKGTVDIRANVSDDTALNTSSCEYTTGSGRYPASYNGNSTAGYCYKTNVIGGSDLNINFRVKDSSNNQGTGTARNYLYDNVGPSQIPLQSPNNNVIFNTGSIFLIWGTSIDTGVGMSEYFYQVALDTGFIYQYQAEWLLETGVNIYGLYDAKFYWRVQAYDKFENLGEWSETRSFTIDTILPIITINNPNSNPAQSKTISASTNEGTLYQAVTNGSTCNASLDFGAYQILNFTSEADNGKKVCYKAVDLAGNTSYLMSNAIAGIDTTSPTINVISPSTNVGTTGILISINTNENAECRYSTISGTNFESMTLLNGNALSHTGNYTANEGSNTLYFRCMDIAGNYSNQVTHQFTVDSINPIVQFVTNTLPASITNSNTVNISITGTNISSYKYKLLTGNSCLGVVYDGNTGSLTTNITQGPIISDQTYSYCIVGYNSSAGWNITGNKYTFIYDNTPPVINVVDGVNSNRNTGDNINLNINYNLAGASGTQYIQTNNSVCDGGLNFSSALSYTHGTDILINNETYNGKYLCFKAKDIAGNITYTGLGTFKIDNTTPTTNVSDTTTNRRNTNIDFIISCGDGLLAGCQNTYYKILTGDISCSAGNYLTYTGSVGINANTGETIIKSVCYYSVDNIGNTEDYKKQLYKIDKQGPSINLIYPLSGGVTGSGTSINFVWSGNDQGVGISGYIFRLYSGSSLITGINTTGTNVVLSNLLNGNYLRNIEGTDSLGNTGISNTQAFVNTNTYVVLPSTSGIPEFISEFTSKLYFLNTGANLFTTGNVSGTLVGNTPIYFGNNNEIKLPVIMQYAGLTKKIEVKIESGTFISKTGTNSFGCDSLIFSPEFVSTSIANEIDDEEEILSAFSMGSKCNDVSIRFSNISGENRNVKVRIRANYLDEDEYNIWYSDDGEDRDKLGESNYENDMMEFETNHMTYFVISKDKENILDNILSIIGGGSRKLDKDNCKYSTKKNNLPGANDEGIDYSDSYYDKDCGTAPEGDIHNMIIDGIIDGSPYSEEINKAYLYAYRAGITTIGDINRADMMGGLLRKHMAKMIVNYAINILGKIPDDSISCDFDDIILEDYEMQYYAIKSCQLGLMGLNSNGTPSSKFYPGGMVTRSQFGTALSRLLYGSTHNAYNNEIRYGGHLKALKENGIMNNISDPNSIEKRGYVMLMLMRAGIK